MNRKLIAGVVVISFSVLGIGCGDNAGEPAISSTPEQLMNRTRIQAALAAPENVATDKRFPLLARAFFTDGNAVSFYELSPGRILSVGTFASGPSLYQRIPKFRANTPTQNLSAIDPSLPIPAALTAAPRLVGRS